MSDEQDKLKLSLEPPKLFGRKKKSGAKAAAAAPAKPDRSAGPASLSKPAQKTEDDAPAVTEAEPVEEPAVEQPAVEDPADAELTTVIEDVEAAEAAPVAPEPEAAERVAAVEPEPAPVAGSEPEPVPEPEQEPVEPVEEPEAATTVIEPVTDPEPESVRTTVMEPIEEPAAEAPVEAAPVARKAPAARKPARQKPPAAKPAARKPSAKQPAGAHPVEVEPEPVSDVDLEDAEIAAMNGDDGPLLTGYRAAAVTGLVVGAAMVVLTWLSLRGCEAVRDTASCGGGPGFLLLVAIFVVCVLLGSALLKAFTIPEPGSSSFLAVGAVAVIALLALIDVLDSWATLIVIPLISIGAYLASVWITKTFVEPADSAT